MDSVDLVNSMELLDLVSGLNEFSKFNGTKPILGTLSTVSNIWGIFCNFYTHTSGQYTLQSMLLRLYRRKKVIAKQRSEFRIVIPNNPKQKRKQTASVNYPDAFRHSVTAIRLRSNNSNCLVRFSSI